MLIDHILYARGWKCFMKSRWKQAHYERDIAISTDSQFLLSVQLSNFGFDIQWKHIAHEHTHTSASSSAALENITAVETATDGYISKFLCSHHCRHSQDNVARLWQPLLRQQKASVTVGQMSVFSASDTDFCCWRKRFHNEEGLGQTPLKGCQFFIVRLN